MVDNVCLFTLGENKGAVWEITLRCDYGCLHCCNKSIASKTLKKEECTTKEVKRGLKRLVDFGINSLYFSGGDPLMRQDFIEILDYAKRLLKNDNLFFATNGKNLTEDIAKKIKEIGVGSVLISLDGHTPKIAEKFRPVKGNFYIAINAIRTLKKYNIPVTMGTIIWKETSGHLEDFIKIAIKEKVDTLFFSWLVPLGRAEEHKEIFVNNKEYFKIGNRLRFLKKKYGGQIKVRFRRFENITDNSLDCPGGSQNFHILPDGRVSVCSWVYKGDKKIISKLNIKNNKMEDIIKEKSIKNFLSMIEERRKKHLGPGCPALCKLNSGTYYSKDLLYKNEK